MVSCFGRPMQLLRGEVGRFQGLAVYVRDGFSAHNSAVLSVVVVKSQLSGFVISVMIIMGSARTEIQIYRIKFLNVC